MDRKLELRDKALEYFLDNGMAELSLRPLGEQIGSSARLLVYHFGSKDGLIEAVMDEVRLRVQTSFVELMAQAGKSRILKTFWAWATAAENSRYVRLLFEVQVLALQNPAMYGRYVERSASSWIAIIENVFPPSANRRAIATLCAAVVDGLMLEFLSSGDLKQTGAALNLFASMLQDKLRAPV
ncbi:TetR/AcrR family transcriptional regulator [Paraburkholderia sp. D15]|uniref:TetR/AcrR family transcriptional regulator n=1 Tax=Paraburkholderia sp. D15 TaxID=2880218 RepID=UPI00247A4B34|nr:TetR/AcrR family transcriptional regulator [Paraburkholderia sp. D15]WGS54229.1 TetR/AcrR family transcriptional regulator [Paraburkholderia sp. D15]WKF60227.1 HTH-type transcriptional regulator BetI [Paraburkholderia busanensis]